MTIQGAIAELQILFNAKDVPIYYKGVIKKIIETIQMDTVPKDFHDKTCEAMAKRHTEEIQRLMPKREEWIDRPQGEWILLEPRYPIEQKVYWNKEQALADTKGNGSRERRKCSCCGYTKSFMCHMKDEQIKLWNYCPNCGADMRKGAADEYDK